MTIRKQLTALITVIVALAAVAGSASAQCGGSGPGGSTRVIVALGNDQSEVPAVSSFDLDLFTRLRINTLSMFSWGRGTVARPGNVRSSFAVLRERRGLTR